MGFNARGHFLISSIWVVLVSSAPLRAEEPFSASEIISAGESALEGFAPAIESDRDALGLPASFSWRDLTLSQPIPVRALDLPALQANPAAEEIAPLLLPARRWLYLATATNGPCGVVSVVESRTERVLLPEAFGRQALAQALAPFVTRYGADNLVLVTGATPTALYVHIFTLPRPNLSPLGVGEVSSFIEDPADARPVLNSILARAAR